MSSDDEDSGNYASDGYECDGYDCDECGYDDAKEVVRAINDDVYGKDDEIEILKTRLSNMTLQMSALIKRVNQLENDTTSHDSDPVDVCRGLNEGVYECNDDGDVVCRAEYCCGYCIVGHINDEDDDYVESHFEDDD